MTSSFVPMTDLARKLLQMEAAKARAPSAQVATQAAVAAGSSNESSQVTGVMVVEKLRTILVRFSGPAGFVALLRRAVALATSGVPALAGVRVEPDGSMTGFAEIANDHAADVIVHLLELLTTFVGHRVMLTLMTEAWPEGMEESPSRTNKDIQ